MILKRKNQSYVSFFVLLFFVLLLYSLWQGELTRLFFVVHCVLLLYLLMLTSPLGRRHLREKCLYDFAEAYCRRDLYMEQSPFGESHIEKDPVFLDLQKELLLRFHLFCLYSQNQEEREFLREFVENPLKKKDREMFIHKIYELM